MNDFDNSGILKFHHRNQFRYNCKCNCQFHLYKHHCVSTEMSAIRNFKLLVSTYGDRTISLSISILTLQSSIFTSHRVPLYPDEHEQVYELFPSVQVLPCKHGFELHSSTSIAQSLPVRTMHKLHLK